MSGEPVHGLPPPLKSLLASFKDGRRAALARAISLVEDEGTGFQEFLDRALRPGPRARRLGVTGPPGAGKSTLLTGLARAYREQGQRVGVVAVDPTSPFSGGALLGDRIRMNELAADPEIFIRSMATRGSLGGLATTTREVMDLMDVFGFERVLVETVGVGQAELEITRAADTVVVVLVPESGDAIQAMKAGLMEIADVFVVNKADRPGADRLIGEIQSALRLRTGRAMREVLPRHGPGHGMATVAPHASVAPTEAAGAGPESAWEVPVVRAVAQSGEGLSELMEAEAAHRTWLEGTGALERRRRARAERRVKDVVERALRRRVWSDPALRARLARGLEGVSRHEETPYSVARAIVAEAIGGDFPVGRV